MTASVKSVVVAKPPMSVVRTLPSRMTRKTADSIVLAYEWRPMWRSIIVEDSSIAVGLARLRPLMSSATWRAPCPQRRARVRGRAVHVPSAPDPA